MSPEKHTERRRTSKGWAKHQRNLKADERRAIRRSVEITTPEDRQRKLNTASWAAVKGLLNLSTTNNPILHDLYEEAMDPGDELHEVVKGWYDAGYKDRTSGNGNGTQFRDEFTDKLLAERLSPLVINEAKPLLKMIDGFLFKPTAGKNK